MGSKTSNLFHFHHQKRMENPSHPTPSSPRRDWAPRATSHGTRVPFETWSKHCEIQLSRAEINLQSSSRVFKGSLLPPKTLSKRKSSTDHGFASEFRSLSISGEPSESILENPFKKHNPQPSLSLSLSLAVHHPWVSGLIGHASSLERRQGQLILHLWAVLSYAELRSGGRVESGKTGRGMKRDRCSIGPEVPMPHSLLGLNMI